MCGRRLSTFAALATAALAVAGVSGAANSVTMDYAETVLNTCNGEFVALQGKIHVEMHSRTNANGTHDQFTMNLQNVTGLAVPSGASYVSMDTDTGSSYTSSDGLPFEFTHIETEILNRLGEDGTLDDFRHYLRVHTTVNANGVITVEREKDEIECR